MRCRVRPQKDLAMCDEWRGGGEKEFPSENCAGARDLKGETGKKPTAMSIKI